MIGVYDVDGKHSEFVKLVLSAGFEAEAVTDIAGTIPGMERGGAHS
ncbi:hypothetical protein [Thermogymnomonas acidicola]|nr:hypothetical protein [Thermogymnomonas acidicola]